MKNLTHLFMACIVLAAMSSCRAYSYTSRVEKVEDTAIQATVTLVDVRVDFEKRIQAESGKQTSEKQAKEEAKYNAIVNGKIDVLIDPIFKIERKSTGSKPYKAWVTGYAGYYTNPRTVVDEIKNLHDVDMKDIEKFVVLENPETIHAIHPCRQEEKVVKEPEVKKSNIAPVKEDKPVNNKRK